MKVLKVCSDACPKLGGVPFSLWHQGTGVLNNGLTYAVYDGAGERGTFMFIAVDINGANKPNKFGQDRFTFGVSDSNANWTPVDRLRLFPSGKFYNFTENTCLKKTDLQNCTYLALTFENLDYLKCPEKLSLIEKHKCDK